MQTVIATRSDLAAWTAAAASQDAVQRRRTQRLFDLAVEASGLTRKRLARALGIDLRSLDDMRELPSIDYVGRIGGALGLKVAQAVGIVALAVPQEREPGEFEVLVRAADLGDDAGALERLAREVAETSASPGALALSLAIAARARSARGDTAGGVAELDAALRLHVDLSDGGLLEGMIDCIRGEHILGCPWRAPEQMQRPQPRGPRRSTARSDTSPSSPADARRQAYASAFELLSGLRPDQDPFEVGRALGSIASLRALVEASAERAGLGAVAGESARGIVHVEERGVGLQPLEPSIDAPSKLSDAPMPKLPHASGQSVESVATLAWVASIAGAAALRAVELARPSPRIEHSAMQLVVQAEFMLEECLDARAAGGEAAGCPTASELSALLRARRSRVQLIEWCQRARGGEDPYPSATEEDRAALIEWGVRFPLWRPRGPEDKLHRT